MTLGTAIANAPAVVFILVFVYFFNAIAVNRGFRDWRNVYFGLPLSISAFSLLWASLQYRISTFYMTEDILTWVAWLGPTAVNAFLLVLWIFAFSVQILFRLHHGEAPPRQRNEFLAGYANGMGVFSYLVFAATLDLTTP